MSGFLRCVFYLAFTGSASFLLGRILPKQWFPYDKFPYKPFRFEQNGKIYEAIGIRRWKDMLPDMSKIFTKIIPPKHLLKVMTAEKADDMLRETCVAEFIHTMLCVTGIVCVWLWKGAGGWIFYMIYVLGNIPFNLIQRYNRPKLAAIKKRLNARETKMEIVR